MNVRFGTGLCLSLLTFSIGASSVSAQDGGWTHWGGNPHSQRYSPHDQVDAGSFEDLEVAWVWRGDNFGPSVDTILRATPIYADGKLFSVELQVVTEDELIDFTPALRQEALEIIGNYEYGPMFLPPLHRDNANGLRGALHCPGSNGGANIPGGASVDPETGILYVASTKACSAPTLIPGAAADPDDPNPIGRTVVKFVAGPGGVQEPQGLPLFKPPYGRITAIDLNPGETLWWIPNGDTPDRIANHPLLRDIDVGNTGQPTHATTLATKTLLMYGEGRGERPNFHAVDKRTGDRLGAVEIRAPTNSAR